ncbi:MAG: Uncharacterized protein G01um10147_638 [Microgenomates group bacterium Gr01-1014_7]|nr:MAG: Uncharacterized protein G01um10147_638 [Microgenomates group bacterium Gr01-1014_7]
MKKTKLLLKTITKLVEVSFREGRVVESQIGKQLKLLKSLPNHEAIWAIGEYLKELKRRQRQHTMYIETVIPLSPAQIKKAKKIVEKRVKITRVLTAINPEILGGFKLKVGDNVWDESILGKLNQVREEILNGRSN